ncbi:MAG TPA: CPBP family intramembrane glutamic endopeptidase [Rubrobacter sp.]|nr:CPBP family intramembrane glutamic endopeptidase [Rubrobacter sp.]
MRRLLDRHPGLFCLAVTLALFVLTAMSRFSFPRSPVKNIKRLPQEAFEPPAGLDRVVSDLKSPDVLFWGLAILLAAALLLLTGLWREAGFNRPIAKNLKLLWFPLFVGALTFSGGVFVAGFDALASTFLVVLVAVFAEELVFRGLLWRALAPGGPVGAMILTSLLAGVLALGRAATDGPWPEAVRITALTVCGGFTYAALRWRTGSLWPVVFVHTAFAFAVDISTLGTVTYRITMLLSTLGFVFYGLFLLRNRQVRSDGGLAGPKPARVR